MSLIDNGEKTDGSRKILFDRFNHHGTVWGPSIVTGKFGFIPKEPLEKAYPL
jgi:hypothetical protein